MPTIWQVVFVGKINVLARQEAVSDGLNQVRGRPLSGILVDLREADVQMTLFDEFDLGLRVASQPKFQGVLIAFLNAPGRQRQSKFLEMVESNRGVLTKGFVDRDEALAWLQSG